MALRHGCLVIVACLLTGGFGFAVFFFDVVLSAVVGVIFAALYEQFCSIFAQICDGHGIAFDPAMVEYLRREHYLPHGIEMRGCHPRDLINQVVNLCRYHNRDLEITTELLDAACQNYFIQDTEGTA